MHYSSNVEPRRMWNRVPEYREWEEFADESACMACGSLSGLSYYADGVAFCSECSVRSRSSHLSRYYDDLGVGD